MIIYFYFINQKNYNKYFFKYLEKSQKKRKITPYIILIIINYISKLNKINSVCFINRNHVKFIIITFF